MQVNKRGIAMLISAVLIVVMTAFAPPATGIAIPQPGGHLSMPKVFVLDGATGWQYEVALFATEDMDKAGQGKSTLWIGGPGLSLCSTHGGGVDIFWAEGSGTEDWSGNYPLTEIQCGTAYGQRVVVDGCEAKIELHGYSHSDYPLVTYTGSITADVSFRKGEEPDTGALAIKIFTPKGPIKLSGPITLADPDAHIQMDTCN